MCVVLTKLINASFRNTADHLPLTHLMRRSASSPPCTIGNRFCSSGRLWAAIQRSNHRIVLHIQTITRKYMQLTNNRIQSQISTRMPWNTNTILDHSLLSEIQLTAGLMHHSTTHEMHLSVHCVMIWQMNTYFRTILRQMKYSHFWVMIQRQIQ